MKMRASLVLCGVAISVLVAGVSDVSAQGALPGATGPRLERLAAPPAGMQVVEVRMADKLQDPPAGAPLPQRFKSSAKLRLELELKSDGPPQTTIEFDVVGKTGKVPIKPGYAVYSAVPADKKYTASYPVEPESGAFADGPYQLKLRIGGAVVAVLNWSIGE